MNKVWLITGAGRGFGCAFAEEAVSRGDFVIAGIRRPTDDEFFRRPDVYTGRIVKLSATPLRNRPHMVFCSQGTS